MSYALNTSHPLYANLVELIGVSGGTLVSLKTARTFTVSGTATFGSGTYGEHFSTVAGGYTMYGATFSPSIGLNTVTNPDMTILHVINNTVPDNSSGNRPVLSSTAANSPQLSYAYGPKLRSLAAYNSITQTGTTNRPGAHMATLTRTGATAHAVYHNGALDFSGGVCAGANSAVAYNSIGGVAGQTSLSADVVWLAVFDKALTSTEVSDLFATLGAGNSFGLVSSPLVTSGTVPAQTGSVSVAYSLNTSSYFSGSQTPFSYSVQAGTLPAGLTLNASTGVISGTPTTAGVSSGIVIRATDAGSNTADTNSFAITINAAATATTLSGPTSGINAVASSAFTVGANGVITGTVIITPSDAADGGTFAPTTVSISAGTPAGTFTYTPASIGTKTISTTNNGALTNPSSISYASNAATGTDVPVLNPRPASFGTHFFGLRR